MPPTLAIARLWYEGSSFTPVPTRLAQFRQREWVKGDAAADFYRGTRTELGAAVDFLAGRREPLPHAVGASVTPWRAQWLRCCAASPGGPVAEADLQEIIGEIVSGIRKSGADA